MYTKKRRRRRRRRRKFKLRDFASLHDKSLSDPTTNSNGNKQFVSCGSTRLSSSVCIVLRWKTNFLSQRKKKQRQIEYIKNKFKVILSIIIWAKTPTRPILIVHLILHIWDCVRNIERNFIKIQLSIKTKKTKKKWHTHQFPNIIFGSMFSVTDARSLVCFYTSFIDSRWKEISLKILLVIWNVK